MNPRTILHSLALIGSLTLASSLGAASLRLECEVDGARQEVSGVDSEAGRILIGPEKTPAPENAVWRLEGDVRENAGYIQWSPPYAIARVDERGVAADPEHPFYSIAPFVHISPAELRPGNMPGSAWTTEIPEGCVVVSVWLVDGKVVKTVANPLPDSPEEDRVKVTAHFDLSGEQAAAGQPVHLLWSSGEFIASRPIFENPQQQEDFVSVLNDDKAALEQGFNPSNARSSEGIPFVVFASEAGAIDCIRLLLRRDVNLAAMPDLHGNTALLAAAAKGRTAVVEALLAAQAPANAVNAFDRTPLDLAVARGHTAAVAALVNAAAPAQPRSRGKSTLEFAIRAGFADIADLLVKAGASLEFDPHMATVITVDQAYRGHASMVRWLATHGVDPSRGYNEGSIFTQIAAGCGVDSVRALIETGANLEGRGPDGLTALMAAVNANNVDVVTTLLEAGADPNALSGSGLTPLHFAARSDNPAMIALLVDHGADPCRCAKDGPTVLDVALMARAPHTSQDLISRRCAISGGGSNLETVIEAAVRLDLAQPILSALRAGWKPSSNLARVWPAARVAQVFGSTHVASALEKAGAPTPSADIPSRVVTISALDAPLKVAQYLSPEDPRAAVEERPEVTVRIGVLIDAKGQPLFPKMNDAEDARLGIAAIEALMKWRFEPPLEKGIPVAVRAVIPFTFEALSTRGLPPERIISLPRATHKVDPVYPKNCRKAKIGGTVVLRFAVDAAGNPIAIGVAKSPHPDLSAAAIAALDEYKFEPARLDERPIVFTPVRLPFSFHPGD